MIGLGGHLHITAFFCDISIAVSDIAIMINRQYSVDMCENIAIYTYVFFIRKKMNEIIVLERNSTQNADTDKHIILNNLVNKV